MAIHPNHIARVLIPVAQKKEVIPYSELGAELDRSGPNPGRGLGVELDKCQEWLKENSLPPLTVLVVQKGTDRPSPDGMFFGRRFGDISDEEIEALKQECYGFEWSLATLKAIGVSHD